MKSWLIEKLFGEWYIYPVLLALVSWAFLYEIIKQL